MKTPFNIGAFAIILNEKNEVLLCHRRDHDLYDLPGGGTESGEAPWETVVREVKEETGLDVAIKRFTGIYNKPKTNDIVFCYVCEKFAGEFKINDEADRFEYFHQNSLPPNLSPKQAERINDALKNHSDLILRKQTGKGSREILEEIEKAKHNSK